MTINGALVTNEYLIFGCDSVASATSMYLNPFALVDRNPEGNFAAGVV